MNASATSLAALLILGTPAFAHDHNRPDLNNWYRQQFSQRGPCCDGTDAKHAEDTEWDTICTDGKCHYRVFLYNRWWDVPETAVVYGPNMAGFALVWDVPTRGINGEVMSLSIRCFMPGSGM